MDGGGLRCISRLLLLLFLVAACVHASDLSTVASEEPVIRAADTLGRIVYLPKVTLLNDHNSDPSIFRAEDINNLVKTSDESYTSVDTIWYSSSDKFKKAVRHEFSVAQHQSSTFTLRIRALWEVHYEVLN